MLEWIKEALLAPEHKIMDENSKNIFRLAQDREKFTQAIANICQQY